MKGHEKLAIKDFFPYVIMMLLHIITQQTIRRHIPEDTNLPFLTCFLFEHKYRNADTETKHSGAIKC
jgi:hypothetical protein